MTSTFVPAPRYVAGVYGRISNAAAKRTSIASVALALVGATGAMDAIGQVSTQTLSIGFNGVSSVPIDSWTVAAIAALLALIGAMVLGRRSRPGAWLWTAVLLGTGALLAMQPMRSAEAIPPTTPLSLVSSPATVQFTFPGAPSETDVVATNATGTTITLTSITLSAGLYLEISVQNMCTVGLVLGPGASCTVRLQEQS